MSYFNDQPNRVTGHETMLIQKATTFQKVNEIHNVILTICEISENNKFELTDNTLEVFNICKMDFKIKKHINKLLKPRIIVSKEITKPITQDVLFLDTDSKKEPIIFYAMKLPICLTFFPDEKFTKTMTKIKYIVVADTKDFAEILSPKNASNLVGTLRNMRNSKNEKTSRIFREFLLND